MAQHLPRPPGHGAAHSLRVTLAYKGDEFRVARVERVKMIAPMPGHPDAPGDGSSGFWFEVHDPAGNLLFHRVLSAPNRIDHEVFSPDPERSIHRQAGEGVPVGEITLIVPDIGGAETLSLAASPSKAPHEPARLQLRHAFSELHRAAQTGGDLRERGPEGD